MSNFEFHYTFTGTLAPTFIKTLKDSINVNLQEARLVRSQHIDLSYMWKDYTDQGIWKPANFGSIFNSGFNREHFLNGLKAALNTKNKRPDAIKTTFNGLIALDIEEIAPRAIDVERDRPDQFKRFLSDLGVPGQSIDNLTSKLISRELDYIHAAILREVKNLRPKAKVGFYGIPNHRDGSLKDTTLTDQIHFTAPCIYQYSTIGSDTAKAMATMIAERVRRSREESAPGTPCYPFVCPHLDAAPSEQRSLTTAEFEYQLFNARDYGSNSAILWGNVGNTQDLTKWINLIPVIKSVFERV